MSNRAERRRQARSHRKVPVVIAGDGIVAAELPGHTFEARPAAELPPKVEGQHRWIAVASYVLTMDEAGAAYSDLPKFLDRENLMYLGIACYDCEQPLGPETPAGGVCPGDPSLPPPPKTGSGLWLPS